uniref:Mu-type opioid receptor n=1 Tax=Gadus morhua TaxID=8049 RepID=A0A8C5BED5_GADMO
MHTPSAPSTHHTCTSALCTSALCTSAPCTPAPCTSGPCTSVQCTSALCTPAPCTSGPCTSVQCTSALCTPAPCTSGPCTSVQCTSALCTSALCTSASCTRTSAPHLYQASDHNHPLINRPLFPSPHLCPTRYTKMKTATNIYIFNLALADALATSTLPFQSVNYLMGTWPFGDVVCKMVLSIDYYNMFTSIFTLTTMSIDRYIAVCHPVKALDFRTPQNAKIVNICNWILSSAIGLPVMFMAATILPKPHCRSCVFIFAFIMPVLIITSVRMLSGSKEKDRNLRRITRMVLVVVAVFIICWTPIHIFVIIKALVNIPRLPAADGHMALLSLNPVLYAFLDENFKRCFREFCTPSPSVLELQNSSRIGTTTSRAATAWRPPPTHPLLLL